MLILGKISTGEFLLRNNVYRQNKNETAERNLDESRLINESGVAENDIDIFFVTNTAGDVTLERVLKGDEFTLTWSNDVITGLNFSAEDDKKLLTVTTDKALIMQGNGSPDIATLTFTVSDPSTPETPDASYNLTKYINCYFNNLGIVKIKVEFVAGVKAISFSKETYLPLGKYSFPVNGRYADDEKTLKANSYALVEIYKD